MQQHTRSRCTRNIKKKVASQFFHTPSHMLHLTKCNFYICKLFGIDDAFLSHSEQLQRLKQVRNVGFQYLWNLLGIVYFTSEGKKLRWACNLTGVTTPGVIQHNFFLHLECTVSCTPNRCPIFDIPVLIRNGTGNTTSFLVVQVINPLI